MWRGTLVLQGTNVAAGFRLCCACCMHAARAAWPVKKAPEGFFLALACLALHLARHAHAAVSKRHGHCPAVAELQAVEKGGEPRHGRVGCAAFVVGKLQRCLLVMLALIGGRRAVGLGE